MTAPKFIEWCTLECTLSSEAWYSERLQGSDCAAQMDGLSLDWYGQICSRCRICGRILADLISDGWIRTAAVIRFLPPPVRRHYLLSRSLPESNATFACPGHGTTPAAPVPALTRRCSDVTAFSIVVYVFLLSAWISYKLLPVEELLYFHIFKKVIDPAN